MKPDMDERLARLMRHDTSFARLITSLGLAILGVAMMFGLGSGQPGYSLIEQAWPIQFWGVIYLSVGGWGIYGSLSRLPHWIRVFHTMGAMYLWAFIALAQFSDQPLPTRLLLILPALVDIWVLVKVVLTGPRKDLA